MARNGVGNAWQALDDPFETEDEDLCPLCMEELDISDLNFRPCPCGYRICRFCWHHIKEDLNKRCPGCRKEYDDSVVEFKPMKPDELKRLQQAKKQREKERKDLELITRKHLANVRVKQKNQVHVQGLTTKMANEDTLAQLKSNDLFTQYGRIQKMFMSRRAGATTLFSPDARYQHVNLYINYSKNSEALACIAGLDGRALPDGHRIKASLGTTKYCPNFLRGTKCHNENCTGAHETAEEVDSGTSNAREEMSTARHAQKESEHRANARNSVVPPPAALPPSASWAGRLPQGPASGSQPPSPAPHVTSLPAAPPLVKQLSGRQHALKTHPLPPKPRRDSFSSSGSTPSHPSLPPNPVAAAAAAKPAVATERSADAAREDRPSRPPAASPALDLPTLPATVPNAPPGVAPPPGLGSSASPAALLLPPGLPVPSADGTADSVPMARTPSLPPGLFPLPEPEPEHDFCASVAASGAGSFAFNLGAIADDVKGKSRAAETTSLSDPTSPFAESFAASLSLNDPMSATVTNDLTSSLLSRSTSFGGAMASSPYYGGSFDPFADTDPRAGLGTPPAAAEDATARNRGSRFGFAKRDSSGFGLGESPDRPYPLALGGSIRSPLPGGPPGLERQDSYRPPSTALPEPLGQGRIVSSSAVPAAAFASSHHHGGKGADSGTSTPDASVLFPGVNLAASYSASALPAALAARGLKSSTPSSAAASSSVAPAPPAPGAVNGVGRPFSSPVIQDGGFPSRLPANAFGNPAAGLPSGFQTTGSPGPGDFGAAAAAVMYQDPAILNMRMAAAAAAAAAAAGPPPPPGLEINGFGPQHAYSPVGQQQQQQLPFASYHGHHPGAGPRQPSYYGVGAAAPTEPYLLSRGS